MSKLLVCTKPSGNTFTVCDYISKHAGIDLKIVNKHDIFFLEKYKTIILCSGVYMGKVHIGLTKWLETIPKNQIDQNTKFYMFMTWFGRGTSDRDALEKLNFTLKRIDVKLEDNYSSCFGKGMGLVRNGHPDNTDFETILNWVNNL